MIKRNETLVQALSGFGFYSALIKMAWGIVLLLPDNTFAANPRSYTNMMVVATEMEWGIFLLIIGTLHAVSVLMYNLQFRIIMQILSVGTWLFIATQFWLSNPVATSNPTGTGAPNYALIAFVDFITVVTRGGNQP